MKAWWWLATPRHFTSIIVGNCLGVKRSRQEAISVAHGGVTGTAALIHARMMLRQVLLLEQLLLMVLLDGILLLKTCSMAIRPHANKTLGFSKPTTLSTRKLNSGGNNTISYDSLRQDQLTFNLRAINYKSLCFN